VGGLGLRSCEMFRFLSCSCCFDQFFDALFRRSNNCCFSTHRIVLRRVTMKPRHVWIEVSTRSTRVLLSLSLNVPNQGLGRGRIVKISDPSSSRSSSISSSPPPNLHQNTIDASAKWLVRRRSLETEGHDRFMRIAFILFSPHQITSLGNMRRFRPQKVLSTMYLASPSTEDYAGCRPRDITMLQLNYRYATLFRHR
jgi:hypothetical protein